MEGGREEGSGTDPFHVTCLSHRLPKTPISLLYILGSFASRCSRKHIIYVVVALSMPLSPHRIRSDPYLLLPDASSP